MKDQDRHKRSRVPSPSPSHVRALDDLDDDNGPSDTGDPKCEQSQVPSPSPSHTHPSGNADDDDDDPLDSDAEDTPGLQELHVGLKPLPLLEDGDVTASACGRTAV